MSAVDLWNGSAFVSPSALKTWNGSAFASVSGAYVWTGSAFEKVWPTGPAFGAVATGATATSGTTLAWSSTDPAGSYVIAYVMAATTRTVTGVTYGGTSMTLLTSITGNKSPSSGVLYAFVLPGGGTGAAVTVTATFNGSGSKTGCSVSYANVTSAAFAVVFGSSTASSQSATCTSSQIISHAFGADLADFTAGSGGTQRFNGNAAASAGLLISDATASATFGGTLSASTPWGGISLVLS